MVVNDLNSSNMKRLKNFSLIDGQTSPLHGIIPGNVKFPFSKLKCEQECIPVGYIPPAAVAVCWRGVLSTVHAGIPIIHPWVGLEIPRAGPADPPGVGLESPLEMHAGIPPLLWTEFLTHASENIILP